MLEHSFTKYRDQIHEQAEDFDCLHLTSNEAIGGMRFNSEAKREQFKVEIAALKRIREKKRPYDHAGGEVTDVDSSSESEQPATAPVSNDRVMFRDEDGDGPWPWRQAVDGGGLGGGHRNIYIFKSML